MIGSNQLVHLDETTVSDEAPPAPRKRRRSPRFRTVFRVARVSARDDQGLARIQNISDEGLMITTSMELSPGDAIQIDLSDDCSLTGLVVWYDRNRCGVRLLRPVNSPALLRQLYEERSVGHGRPLRLAHRKPVVVVSHKGNFNPGLAVKVLLAPGMERSGVVRWSKDGVAGIALTEILSVEELGSMRSF